MIEAIKNRTMAQAWRLVWQHKILWMYALIFYAFEELIRFGFFLATALPAPRLTGLVNLAIAISIIVGIFVSYIFSIIVHAAFYVNTLSWLDNKRVSFINSFKLNNRYGVVFVWAAISGLVMFFARLLAATNIAGGRQLFDVPPRYFDLHANPPTSPFLTMINGVIRSLSGGVEHVFTLYAPPSVLWGITYGITKILLFLLFAIFIVGCVYVTIGLVSSRSPVWTMIKRSFWLVRRTWGSLLGIFAEIVFWMIVLMLVRFNMRITFFSGFITITAAPLIVILFALLVSVSVVLLYKRQLMREQNDTRDQIPHNPF